jgi:3-methylfumaryl-CoA hydratase
VEGYPGLIVHGPLIATLLVDLVRRHAPTQWISGFQFKAVRPTFDLNPFHVNARPHADGRTIDVWASDHDGYLTMTGTVTLENNAT